MGIEEAWGGRLGRPIAPHIRGRRAASCTRERSVSISGELNEENYQAYLGYSNNEYRFGSPEAVDDRQNLDLTLTKGLSYPYPVYMHTCSNRYILRRTLSDIRKVPAKAFILSVILNGELNIRQNGRMMTMSANQLTFIDLNSPYMIDVIPPNDVEFKSVFTYLPMRMVSSDVCPYMPYIMEMDPNEVSTVSALLTTLIDHGSNLTHLSSKSIFDAIFHQVNKTGAITTPANLNKIDSYISDDDRWNQVLSYINLMYSNYLLDVATVAQKIGISQRSLNYLFAQHGTTFSKTLWNLRLTVVRDWLSDPSMNDVAIRQIAADAGFKSAAHLSTFFKSRMGCSPREFRQRMNVY